MHVLVQIELRLEVLAAIAAREVAAVDFRLVHLLVHVQIMRRVQLARVRQQLRGEREVGKHRLLQIRSHLARRQPRAALGLDPLHALFRRRSQALRKRSRAKPNHTQQQQRTQVHV